MVVEALRWILLGLALGVVFEGMRHVAAFQRLLNLPDWQSRALELESENRSLSAQAALIPQLRAEIERARTATPVVAESETAEPRTPESSPIPQVLLEDIESIPAEFRTRLRNAGYATPAELAAANLDTLRNQLDLMPWDMAEPEVWIAEAERVQSDAELNATPTDSFQPNAPSQSAPDYRSLPRITPAQADALARSFPTYESFAKASDTELLAVINAMPWDDVPVKEWKDFVKPGTA